MAPGTNGTERQAPQSSWGSTERPPSLYLLLSAPSDSRAGTGYGSFIFSGHQMALPVVLLLSLSVAGSEKPQPESAASRLPFSVHGFLESTYTYRSRGGETDHDLDQFLSLRFADRRKRWVRGYVSARFSQDLDGFDRSDPFAGFPDTFGRTYERLSAAYLEVTPRLRLLQAVRFGRQLLPEVSFPIRFDGVHASTGKLEDFLCTRLAAFGGIPDHIGESSRRLDRLLGASLCISPPGLARLCCTYVRLCDTYRVHDALGSSVRHASRDDYIVFTVRRRFGERLFLSGKYSLLNGNARDARVRALYYLPEIHSGLSVSYSGLFKTQAQQSAELDPYVSVLRVYGPYHQFSARLWHDFNDAVSVETGLTVRRLTRGRHLGPFNHEFERYWGGLTVRQWPLDGTELSLLCDFYDTGSDRHLELEGWVNYEFCKGLSAEVGSGYSLFQEDRYTLRERVDVRTGFARISWDVLPQVRIRCGYTVEDDQSRTTHLLELALRWRF